MLQLRLAESEAEVRELRAQLKLAKKKWSGCEALVRAVALAGLSWWVWDMEEEAIEIYASDGDASRFLEPLQRQSTEEFFASIHPDDRSGVREKWEQHLGCDGGMCSCECRRMDESGDWIWYSILGYAESSEAPVQPSRMFGTIQGINRRKVAEIEASLREQIALEGERIALLGAWEYDLEVGRVHWSKGVFDIYGLPGPDPLPVEKCISYYAAKDQGRVREAVESVVAEEKECDIECELIDAAGVRKIVRLILRVGAKRAGEVTRLIGVIQDITHGYTLRKSMQAFFRLTPDLVAAVNSEGKLVDLNPSWEQALGRSRSELMGAEVLSVVHPDDREGMRLALRRAMESQVIAKLENRVVAHSGGELWMSWRIFGDHDLGLVFLSARDTTRRHRMERALIDAKVQAEEANRAKMNFLAMMSHELRTPLNPILGFADLLLTETENPEHVEILESIIDAGQNLTSVIGDVLDFAKIESGRTELSEVEFDVENTIRQRIRVFSAQVRGRQIDLRYSYDLSPQLSQSERLLGDEEKLSRVLNNLIANAIKFTEAGEVHVDCSLLPLADGRASLRVDVIDTGIGIDSERVGELFQPFQQIDNSRTRRYGGTGLGLAICKRIVDLMGGEISVKSRLGAGATFSFFVPLRRVTAEKKGPQSENSVINCSPSELRIEGRPHVFLVEDNATNTFYAKRLLVSLGCEVTSVSDGEQALAEYSPSDHDIILLDLHMPGIGGVEVLQSIRETEAREQLARVPIAILTADVLPATRELCVKNGADAFLTKPVKIREVHRSIVGLLKKPSVS